MRLFIGIPFSDRIRKEIHHAVMKLEPHLAKGRLSAWEGYHITLKFLGEVSDEQTAALSLALEGAQFETGPFDVQLTHLGAFRKSGGDVLWLGITVPPQLQALQQEVEALAVHAGFEPEARAFSPHLTLARGVRYAVSFDTAAGHWPLKPLRERIDRVALFHSTRTEAGLAYVPLVSRRL